MDDFTDQEIESILSLVPREPRLEDGWRTTVQLAEVEGTDREAMYNIMQRLYKKNQVERRKYKGGVYWRLVKQGGA